ncbi:hypothetical protein [Pseudonocardia sp. HH130630-07]|uniref:hypothetical protein n=1 Tax=Pseudonocardia sp. HH130630-07 TaxID=1690815 RepID=UPI0008151C33|nr:hypothetical protein [Pseudonocardia sp. HH130630-07]ANY06285.1 hypothetical protein AFB00_08230 [Pseudonocardia sp. HH130630-07]
MDGARIRLVAALGPLALVAALGLAAVLGQTDERSREDGTTGVRPAADRTATGRADVSTARLDVPRTTPRPAPEHPGHRATAPATTPARTAGAT